MGLLIKLAWRNIFRNTRRTVLAGLAMGIGLAAMIFTDALIVGMDQSMVRTATHTFLGQAQIHAEGFRATFEVEKTIRDLERVLRSLDGEAQIKSYALRTQAFAMLTSPADFGTITLFGIDPEHEQAVSKIDEALVQGDYIEERGQILVGSKLAEILTVDLGDRVVVTVAQAGSGELMQEMFRIRGIFHLNIREMDANMAFIKLDQAQELLGLGARAHEIALHFERIAMAGDPSLEFWKRYGQNGNEALGWKQLVPELDAALQLSQFSMFMVTLILFGVVALSTMNTLFMSLYERMFEFGILRAVGTRPFRMAALVLFEAGGLALVSIGIGLILGCAVTYYVSLYGIDYIGIEYGGVTFRELIYPIIVPGRFIFFPLWVFLFALVASIYPAVFAARIKPAVAMRRSF